MPLTDEQNAAVDRFLGEIAGEDAGLAKAILTAGELTNGDPSAVSPKGARGLMQLTPSALQDIGRDPKSFDYDSPAESLRAGVEYIQLLKSKYGFTNPLQIAAAYNAGPSTVQAAVKAGDFTTLPEETQNYVRRMHPALSASTAAVMPAAYAPSEPQAMDHPTKEELRAGRGPVDIPSGNALTYQAMGQQRDAEPWYQRVPSQLLDPLAELGIAAARAAGGSTLPAPPVDRLLTDVAQTVGLAAPFAPVGRIVSAAIQGGAGLATGLQQAAEQHATTGQSWQDQVAALTGNDALNIGSQVVVGSALGFAFGGAKPKALSPQGAIAQGRRDLATMQARTAAERAAPPPRSAEVAAAFRKLNPEQEVNATAWRSALLRHGKYEGKAIPKEVQAVADRLIPEMRTEIRPGSLAGHTFLPDVPPVDVIQVPTGRYFAKAGDLLDANMALGNMVNTPEARAALPGLGHTAANLRALRNTLSDELEAALPAGQRALYQTARGTAKDVAQDTAGLRLVERFILPEEARVNGPGMYGDLLRNAEKRIQVLGPKRYGQLRDFARSIQAINTDPEKASVMAKILGYGAQFGLGAAVGYYGNPAAGVALAVLPRAVYGLATSNFALKSLDAMARWPVTSKAFLTAAGRLTLAHTLVTREETPQQDGPAPVPVEPPMAAP